MLALKSSQPEIFDITPSFTSELSNTEAFFVNQTMINHLNQPETRQADEQMTDFLMTKISSRDIVSRKRTCEQPLFQDYFQAQLQCDPLDFNSAENTLEDSSCSEF